MEQLVSFLLIPNHTEAQRITFDQKVFDLAVRGPVNSQQLTVGPLSNILNELEKAYLSPPPGIELNWTYLPHAVLLHWRDGGINFDSETLAGVHVWSGFGPPAKQIDQALHCFAYGKLRRVC